MKKYIIIALLTLIGGGAFAEIYPAITNVTFDLTLEVFDVRDIRSFGDDSWKIVTDIQFDKALSDETVSTNGVVTSATVSIRKVRADVTVTKEEVATAMGINTEDADWLDQYNAKTIPELRQGVIVAAQTKVISLVTTE